MSYILPLINESTLIGPLFPSLTCSVYVKGNHLDKFLLDVAVYFKGVASVREFQAK